MKRQAKTVVVYLNTHTGEIPVVATFTGWQHSNEAIKYMIAMDEAFNPRAYGYRYIAVDLEDLRVITL